MDNDCSTLTADVVDEDGDGFPVRRGLRRHRRRDPARLPPRSATTAMDNDCDGLTDGGGRRGLRLRRRGQRRVRVPRLQRRRSRRSIPEPAELCNDGVDNDCDAGDAGRRRRRTATGATACPTATTPTPWSGPAPRSTVQRRHGQRLRPGHAGPVRRRRRHLHLRRGLRRRRSPVNPGAVELCSDGIDNDCDAATLDVRDGDADGFACTFDCDDDDANVHPGAGEVCDDGIDNDCDPPTPDLFDADGDGVPCDVDCDDADPGRYPGNAENCDDGIDNDCDTLTDGSDGADCGCADGDSDGYACLDCNDADPAVNPGAAEVCNDGVDNDCDPATLDVDDAGRRRVPLHRGLQRRRRRGPSRGGGGLRRRRGQRLQRRDARRLGRRRRHLRLRRGLRRRRPAGQPGPAEVGCDGVDNDCDTATSDLADADGDAVYCADVTVRGGGVNATTFGSDRSS